MSRTILALTIPGRPRTKGSLKAIMPRGSRRPVLVEDHVHSKPYRRHIVKTIWQHQPRFRLAEPCAGPVFVTAVFLFEQVGKTAAGMSHPMVNAGVNANGDLDKLMRNVLDALQDARVYVDDCQVVGVSSAKAWGAQAGLQLAVEEW